MSLLKNIETGVIINLNLQLSDSDSININLEGQDKFTLLFCPRAFLQEQSGPFYSLMQNGEEKVSFQIVKQVVEIFFKEGKRDANAEWKEEILS